MTVRRSLLGDDRELRRLNRRLFGTEQEFDPWDEQIFVVDRGDGRLGGYIAVSRRPWSEGSAAKPVAHVEAWFVDRDLRRKGLGRKLMKAAEHWAALMGLAELCADVELRNHVSLAAHQRMGFEPTVQLQYFRKPLG
jgi:aminoglycoside 6'-N-acetyltransferase I